MINFISCGQFVAFSVISILVLPYVNYCLGNENKNDRYFVQNVYKGHQR